MNPKLWPYIALLFLAALALSSAAWAYDPCNALRGAIEQMQKDGRALDNAVTSMQASKDKALPDFEVWLGQAKMREGFYQDRNAECEEQRAKSGDPANYRPSKRQ